MWPDESRPGCCDCFIFDIDGTLANCKERAERFLKKPEGAIHFKDDELGWVPDWDNFYERCDLDDPVVGVCHVLGSLIHSGFPILFVTGRPENVRDKTIDWLCKTMDMPKPGFMAQCSLFMRSIADHRQDFELKKQIYNNKIRPYYNVLGVFEDRDQCVQMWRDLGLQCFQVADGAY